VLGVVLAGGRSRRMGRDKAAIAVHDTTLLAAAVGVLRTVLDGVCVVGRTSQPQWADPSVVFRPDIRPGLGPIGGIETALVAAAPRACLVIGCDMPALTGRSIEELLRGRDAGADCTLTRHPVSGEPEPLLAIYEQSCLPVVRRMIDAADCALRHLPAWCRVAWFDLPAERVGELLNVNRPEDLAGLA
jgi:molybdopterin-guanine dinucleotide biosynthesis protein A